MSFSPRLGRNLLIEWCVWRCVSLKALPTHTAPFPRPHPPFVCTGFTPTSFNICFACAIKLCHRQKRENLKGSRAGAPALPPPPPPPPTPHWGKAERGLSRKPLLFFFIYLWVTEKGAVVITTSVPPPHGSNQRSANIKGAHGKCMSTGWLRDLLHASYTDWKKKKEDNIWPFFHFRMWWVG